MKRVLFVDDDAAVLDGLRLRLHGRRGQWEMVFVDSASRAIAEIEHRLVDVVVSDLRMPTMDGVQLLEVVRERWPECIRIVLSGYAAEEQSTRALPVAHQYVSKPCDATHLESIIGRCLHLHDVLRRPALRSIVGRVRHLPALPRTYRQLRDLIARPDASVSSVAAVIAADTAFTAKVLQVVNSAFFRRARIVKKIDAAVTHLGFATIASIALSVELFSNWTGKALRIPSLDPEALQARAQSVAAVIRALTAGTSISDDAMLAGLLHNIGYWILLQECSDELERAERISRERGIPLFEIEYELIGASHAEVGAYLLGLWGLPPAVIEAVALQYRASEVPQMELDVLGALVIAQSLVSTDDDESDPVLNAAPIAGAEYLRAINAPFDWQEAHRRAAAALGGLHA